MKKKRILIISPFPPGIGGVSVSSQRLFDRLITEKDFNVKKYSLSTKNKSVIGFKIGIMIKFIFMFIYICIAKKFDVIHFNNSGILRRKIISKIIPIITPKSKIIFTIHGDIVNLLKEDSDLSCLDCADSIIAVKKGDAKYFPVKYRKIVHEIPAFIFPDINKNIDLPLSLKSFFNTNKKIIVMNGAMIFDNNYFDLYGFQDSIDLYYLLKNKHYDIKLLMLKIGIIKDDISKKYYNDFLDQIKDDPDIKLFDSNIEFWPILLKSDIYLRPTKTDGDALSIREALFLKKTVIATDVVERPEGVISYNNMTDLLEKTISVLETPKLYDSKIKQKDFYCEIINLYR